MDAKTFCIACTDSRKKEMYMEVYGGKSLWGVKRGGIYGRGLREE